MTKTLIIDDDVDRWFQTNNCLRKHQLAPKFANNLGLVKRYLEKDDYSILFVDPQFSSGFNKEFLDYVHYHHPNTTIVVLGKKDPLKPSWHSPRVHFLKKPFSAIDLENLLQDL